SSGSAHRRISATGPKRRSRQHRSPSRALEGTHTMKSSREQILTSHVGSLPRPDTLIAANKLREEGGGDEAAFQRLLQHAVVGGVERQKKAGGTGPDDGEFGKSMGHAVNCRAWLSYAFARLSGVQHETLPVAPPRP